MKVQIGSIKNANYTNLALNYRFQSRSFRSISPVQF